MAYSGGRKRKPDDDDIEPIGTHKRQSNMGKNEREHSHPEGATCTKILPIETPDIALEEQEGPPSPNLIVVCGDLFGCFLLVCPTRKGFTVSYLMEL